MTVFRRLTFVVALGIGVGGLALPTATHAEDGQTYLVAEGDTLIGIASKSGIRLSELLRSNNLRLTSLIMPGQQLDIPSSTGAPASSTSTPTSSSTVHDRRNPKGSYANEASTKNLDVRTRDN